MSSVVPPSGGAPPGAGDGPGQGGLAAEDFMIRVGDPIQWAAFARRNQPFLDRLPRLVALTKAVIFRDFEALPLDRAIHSSGELAQDNFWEILILAANGYGWGALGIVRTMFERVVVSKWLAEHPGDLDAFLNFYWIVKWKQVAAIQSTLGKILTDEQVADVKRRRDDVIAMFPTVACDECGAQGPVVNWSNHNMVAMAKKTGMGPLLFECYYESSQQVHHSVSALMNHTRLDADDAAFAYAHTQPDVVDKAVRSAHQLLLIGLAVQINHFKLEGLDSDFKACEEDLKPSWPGQLA